MRKIYILYIATISILSFLAYINNTSALDYSSNVGIGFTFNPTLSVSLSSSDLVIPNLVPGSTLDSNSINVSVATNAAYGYTLSANVNDENLVHSNNINAFSSIATNADLSSLDDSDESNIWGYSYKNNIASTPTWSNYSGLSNSVNKVLFNTDSNSSGSIDFKMAAKASETQPSGTYTGTINFIATTKPMPKTIEDIAYMQTFAELDATDLASVKSSMVLNSDYILKDVRDEKEYYVTKLEDGNVWMTQNLDLDIDETKTYTHYDTDLGWNDPNNLDSTATWQPIHSTVDFTGDSVGGWMNNNMQPYSANPGNIYYESDDLHYYSGNYYNWPAAVASNDASDFNMPNNNATSSICPCGWRLPRMFTTGHDPMGSSDNDFSQLNILYNNGSSGSSNGLISRPLWFVRSGFIDGGSLRVPGSYGYYWSAIYNISNAYDLNFAKSFVYPIVGHQRSYGFSVRCVAR